MNNKKAVGDTKKSNGERGRVAGGLRLFVCEANVPPMRGRRSVQKAAKAKQSSSSPQKHHNHSTRGGPVRPGLIAVRSILFYCAARYVTKLIQCFRVCVSRGERTHAQHTRVPAASASGLRALARRQYAAAAASDRRLKRCTREEERERRMHTYSGAPAQQRRARTQISKNNRRQGVLVKKRAPPLPTQNPPHPFVFHFAVAVWWWCRGRRLATGR